MQVKGESLNIMELASKYNLLIQDAHSILVLTDKHIKGTMLPLSTEELKKLSHLS